MNNKYIEYINRRIRNFRESKHLDEYYNKDLEKKYESLVDTFIYENKSEFKEAIGNDASVLAGLIKYIIVDSGRMPVAGIRLIKDIVNYLQTK